MWTGEQEIIAHSMVINDLTGEFIWNKLDVGRVKRLRRCLIGVTPTVLKKMKCTVFTE